jgi:hypothetical protein
LKNIVKYERNTIVLMKKAYSNRKSQWKHSWNENRIERVLLFLWNNVKTADLI